MKFEESAKSLISLIDKRIEKYIHNTNIVTQYMGVITSVLEGGYCGVRIGGTNTDFIMPNKTNQALQIGDQVYIQTIGENLNTGFIISAFKFYQNSKYTNNFKIGETYLSSLRTACSGFLTDAGRQITFTVITPKTTAGLECEIISLKANPRSIAGTYLLSNGYVEGGYDLLSSDSDFRAGIIISDTNVLYFWVRKKDNTAWDVTNNTPVSVELNKIEIKFIPQNSSI